VKQKTVWEAMTVFDFKGSILLTTSVTCFILGIVSLSNNLIRSEAYNLNRTWVETSTNGPIRM
jgi:hypothetical protein